MSDHFGTLCIKRLKNLDDELTDLSIIEKLLISEKSCLFYSVLTLTKLKYFMSYTIRLHYKRRHALSIEQGIVSKEYLERFGPHIYKFWSKDEFSMTLLKLRLGFLFTDLSSYYFWNISGGFCIQVFLSLDKWWLKIICDIKLKLIYLHTRYKNNIRNHDVIDVVLVSLLLTLNIFDTLF